MFYQEVVHVGLNKRRVITGKDPDLVALKAAQQAQVWEEEWSRKQAREEEQVRTKHIAEQQRQAKLNQKEREREEREAKKQKALDLTANAQQRLDHFRLTLSRGLIGACPLDWATLKDTTPFPFFRPTKPEEPTPPKRQPPPPPPPRPDPGPEPQFKQPALHDLKLGILDKVIGSRRQQRIAEAAANNRRLLEAAKSRYESALAQWKQRCVKLVSSHT
jgi:hypothetical protein